MLHLADGMEHAPRPLDRPAPKQRHTAEKTVQELPTSGPPRPTSRDDQITVAIAKRSPVFVEERVQPANVGRMRR